MKPLKRSFRIIIVLLCNFYYTYPISIIAAATTTIYNVTISIVFEISSTAVFIINHY
jgi:hypothetical protein